MTTTYIRQATNDDMQRIWEIRNHPKTRPFFNTTDEIPYKTHSAWFEKKYIHTTGNFCFVLVHENTVIGYCRYDLEDGAYLVSIAIDPAYCGKGLAQNLLANTVKKIAGHGPITAEVLKNNPASLNIFKKNNFAVTKENATKQYLHYEQ